MNVKSKMLAGVLLSVAVVMPLVSACGSSSASDGAASASGGQGLVSGNTEQWDVDRMRRIQYRKSSHVLHGFHE